MAQNERLRHSASRGDRTKKKGPGRARLPILRGRKRVVTTRERGDLHNGDESVEDTPVDLKGLKKDIFGKPKVRPSQTRRSLKRETGGETSSRASLKSKAPYTAEAGGGVPWEPEANCPASPDRGNHHQREKEGKNRKDFQITNGTTGKGQGELNHEREKTLGKDYLWRRTNKEWTCLQRRKNKNIPDTHRGGTEEERGLQGSVKNGPRKAFPCTKTNRIIPAREGKKNGEGTTKKVRRGLFAI